MSDEQEIPENAEEEVNEFVDDEDEEDEDDSENGSGENRRGLPPGINSGRWTREEHNVFLRGLETHGKEWKKIADLIKTRTVVQIRTHAQKYFQKVAKTTGGPVMSTSKKDVVVRPPNRKRKSDDDEEEEDDVEEEDGEEEEVAPPSKKPNSITVPPLSSRRDSSESGDRRDGGGATPRTVAAATILLRPRVQHKLESGGVTPKTRETAAWVAANEDQALQVLGKRRRSNVGSKNAGHSPRLGFNDNKLSWEAATTASRSR